MANKIAILQLDSVLGDVEANLAKIDAMIASIQDKDVKMALFCEYGLTGYCTDLKRIASPVPGRDSEGLGKIAQKYGMWVCGGTAEMAGDKIANTVLMLNPEGQLAARYRKVHPFGDDEKKNILYGDELVLVDTPLGKVGLTICYDMIFPEYVRALALAGADLVLNPTFWFADNTSGPAGWGPEQALSLARIRALENSVYVAMACRTGEEEAPWGGKLRGFGHSSVSDPVGHTVANATLGETVLVAEIDLAKRRHWAEYVDYLGDRRPDLYKQFLDF